MCWPKCIFVLSCCAIAMVVTGCTTYVTPPKTVARPATIYIADYGKHASLILPTTNKTVTEYTYGDWDFFALGHTDFLHGLQAMFFSNGACLGKRTEKDLEDKQKIAKKFGAIDLHPLQVDQADVERMVDELDNRYRCYRSEEYFNSGYETHFVKDPEHYSWLNNSNMMTARWLRDMNCEIFGTAVFSKFEVEKPGDATGNPFFKAEKADSPTTKPAEIP